MFEQQIRQIEQFLHRDPACRGLIGLHPPHEQFCRGHLAEAAYHIAESGRSVAIVTGFYIPTANPPAAETDGPPGALMLAEFFVGLGLETVIVTDERCAGVLRVGVEFIGLSSEAVVVYPEEEPQWFERFLQERQISHLIAVERPGPSHTPESLLRQDRRNAPPIEDFRRRVPDETHDRCHNMRGQAVDNCTPPLHGLFEAAVTTNPKIRSIGIGDGGNEIGMGSISWEALTARLPDPETAHIACRITTDWTIVSGTSNWGAFGLTAAIALVLDRADLLHGWTAERHRCLLEALVREGPAVDGVTLCAEPTVDGLPFLTYIQPWLGIAEVLEIPS